MVGQGWGGVGWVCYKKISKPRTNYNLFPDNRNERNTLTCQCHFINTELQYFQIEFLIYFPKRNSGKARAV